MISPATIEREIRALRAVQDGLHADVAADQVYGAIEALRWVLGNGPRPIGLGKPLGIKREQYAAPVGAAGGARAMSNMRFGDGSELFDFAKTAPELLAKMKERIAGTEAKLVHAEIFTAHPFVGEYRRCGDCGRTRDDPLHVAGAQEGGTDGT